MIKTFRWGLKLITGAATVPPSGSHKNGDWTPNDLYIGELAMDATTGEIYSRSDAGVYMAASPETSVQIKKIRIPAAAVLTGNATPVELIPAPSGTDGIMLLSMVMAMDAGTQYATNTTVRVYYDTLTDNYALLTNFLATAGASATYVSPLQTNSGINVLSNKALRWQVTGGNPTGGNRDVIVYVSYLIFNNAF